VLLVDETVTYNGAMSQFPVSRAFQIIKCQILQLLLNTSIIIIIITIIIIIIIIMSHK
jgi:hypothetical protein